MSTTPEDLAQDEPDAQEWEDLPEGEEPEDVPDEEWTPLFISDYGEEA